MNAVAAVCIVSADKPACSHRLKGVSGRSKGASFRVLGSDTDNFALVEGKACRAKGYFRQQ